MKETELVTYRRCELGEIEQSWWFSRVQELKHLVVGPCVLTKYVCRNAKPRLAMRGLPGRWRPYYGYGIYLASGRAAHCHWAW